MNFGEKLKALRKQRHMNQTQLAAALQHYYPSLRASQTGVVAWEKRELPVAFEALMALSVVLGAPLGDFMPDGLTAMDGVLRDYAARRADLDRQIADLDAWRDRELTRLAGNGATDTDAVEEVE